MSMIGGSMIRVNVAPVREVAGADRSGQTDKRARRWVAVLLTATVAGALLGPLDLAGQVHSPYPYANLFNSPAVWAAAAFVFGRWATGVVPAVVGAIVVRSSGSKRTTPPMSSCVVPMRPTCGRQLPSSGSCWAWVPG